MSCVPGVVPSQSVRCLRAAYGFDFSLLWKLAVCVERALGGQSGLPGVQWDCVLIGLPASVTPVLVSLLALVEDS